MTNTLSGSLAGSGADRTRLVVPRLHQSVWASSNVASNSQPRQDNRQPVARPTATKQSNQPRVEIRPKSYAGIEFAVAADKVSSRVAEPAVSRTARTIQPLTQTQTSQQSTKLDTVVANAAANIDKEAGFMPTIPQYADEAIPVRQRTNKPSQVRQVKRVAQSKQSSQAKSTSTRENLSEADKAAILQRAAVLRQRAKQQAEAKAKAELAARIKLAQQKVDSNTASTKMANDVSATVLSPQHANVVPAANVFMPAAVEPVSEDLTDTIDDSAVRNDSDMVNASSFMVNQGGAAAIPYEGNFLGRLAGAKVTISFKVNKQRIFTVLRYLAVVLIIAASGYLAWDTYTTNQSVKETFGGAGATSAMSIAGTNPATADRTAVSQEDKAAYTVPADQPRYITIPKIGINARVMSVGVNSNGNIDTPANLNDTAWYDGSAKPGQDGQVFIDGHTSFSNTINAAFNDLPKLQQGDVITIERGDGVKINYIVNSVETVDADKVDMGKALNPPAGATKGLTLMTCTGTFNYRTQTADKRLIVYATQQ